MKQTFTLVFTLLFINVFAQRPNLNCGIVAKSNGSQKNTSATASGANIDVVYHRINWRLNPDSAVVAIKGTVVTYFKTKSANVSSINFDLIKASYNNANLTVTYHGSPATFSFPTTGNVNLLNIIIPNIAAVNTLDSVTINYGGTPPATSGEAYGMQRTGTAGSTAFLWTLAESYEDRNFWPCKHDMTDKIDSMLISINCPSVHIATTNGKLISEVTSGSNKIYTYKTNYPTASYLVAFGVGRYNKYVRTPVDVNGTSVPITYFRTTALTAANLAITDLCRNVLDTFSTYFGEYPFKNEGYGMYEFGFGGGMEHQTNSAMSSASFINKEIITHELAHQWFGDAISFATWSDLWIAEGFAEYLTVFAAEKIPAMALNSLTLRSNIKTTARGTALNTTPITVTDITNSNTIWGTTSGTSVYQRGAMFVSMLRKLAGDAKFYQALQNIINDPNIGYKSAVTNDFKLHFEAVTGLNLTNFFNDWIYGYGNASYNVTWGNFGNRVNIQLNQTATGSVTHFSMPVVLRIKNATKDTTVVIYDDNNIAGNAGAKGTALTNVISFNLSFIPTGIDFDPLAETMATGTVATDITLDISHIDLTGTKENMYNNLQLSVSDNATDVILERSHNGNAFESVGQMDFTKIENSYKLFSYKDFNRYGDVTYYRVRSKNILGAEKYSNIIKINTNTTEKLQIIENPIRNGQLKVIVKGDLFTKNTTLAVVNMSGKIVLRSALLSNVATEDISGLAAGQYVTYIINNQNKIIATAVFIK